MSLANTNKSRLCHSFGEKIRRHSLWAGTDQTQASRKATSPVSWLCPSPPPSGSVQVRDFWSRLLPDHTPLRPITSSPFGTSRFFEPSLTQLTHVGREIFQARSPELTTHPATTDPATNLAKKGAGAAGAGPPHPADWPDEPKTRGGGGLTSRQRRRGGTNTIGF